jgi:hypothetical protein
VVICREVVDGQPAGVTSAFNDAAKVAAFYRYRDQAAGTAEAVWMRNGTELTRSQREIEAGNGWVAFSVLGGGGGSLPIGKYEVILSLPGRPPLRTSFTIGGAQG